MPGPLERRQVSKTISDFNAMIVELFKERKQLHITIEQQENQISEMRHIISELLEEIEGMQDKLLFYTSIVESEEF